EGEVRGILGETPNQRSARILRLGHRQQHIQTLRIVEVGGYRIGNYNPTLLIAGGVRDQGVEGVGKAVPVVANQADVGSELDRMVARYSGRVVNKVVYRCPA